MQTQLEQQILSPSPKFNNLIIVNLAYEGIKNDTVINSASGALIVPVSHEEEKCGDDTTGGKSCKIN